MSAGLAVTVTTINKGVDDGSDVFAIPGVSTPYSSSHEVRHVFCDVA